MPLIYAFDHPHETPPKDLKDLLGRQGGEPGRDDVGAPPAGAARVHHHDRGLPGPPRDRGLARRARRRDRRPTWSGSSSDMGRRLGDPDDPLLVSVRSGAKFSMPGMMDTVLNLGLNDESVRGLARQTDNERFALDSYRRFVAMFGRIVLGIDGAPVRPAVRRRQAPGRGDQRRRGAHRAPPLPGAALPAGRAGRDRRAVPPGPVPPAPHGGRGRVRLLDGRAGPSPTAPASTSPTTWARR